jgi:hypothetical protein
VKRLGQPPAALQRALDRLDADAESLLGSSRLSVLTWEDRPFSYLARLSVTRNGEQAPASHVYVKVFKCEPTAAAHEAMSRRVSHDFATTRRAFDLMRSHEEVGAVPPLVCYPEELTIVTTQIDGVTLLDYLCDQARWLQRHPSASFDRAMSNVGRWVKTFQATGAPGEPLTHDWFCKYIDHRLMRLVKGTTLFSEDDRRRVLRQIDDLWSGVDPSECTQVPIHADMALGNVLVSGSRIVVLDFAMARLGGELHDLARLFVQIDLLNLKPQLRRSMIVRAQTAMLEGFDCSLRPDRPLFRLHELLHRINHFGTLTLKKRPLPESIYNMLVRRQHRAYFDRELSRRPI